jgi:hypothetical protein
MKNITLSADEDVIERARAVAHSQHTTLNAMFREWLDQIASTSGSAEKYEALMKRLSYVDFGDRRFTRDEMNER